MRILHTSDWHLGRSLYGKRRYEEFSSFLGWLLATIEEQRIDILLVSGDIFDTTTPGNRAQGLYYRFLIDVSRTCCTDVVITAGNHDSPSFLDAPQELLKALNVHVIGAAREDPAEEVLTLQDRDGNPAAIVCAVPYLRDRDIRRVSAGESAEDKDSHLINGLKDHYRAVCDHAEALQEEYRNQHAMQIPIIAMGHLFAAGGKTYDGDGVRELYIGSLAHIGGDIFPDTIDYLALGHLHIPQRIGSSETMRYCGSPLPIGFSEAKQQKLVLVAEFSEEGVSVAEVPIPIFQRLAGIRGDLDELTGQIDGLKAEQTSIWLEVEYTGEEVLHDLKGQLDLCIEGSELEILRIRNRMIIERTLKASVENESLDDLDEYQVFDRFTADHEISDEMKEELLPAYREIVKQIQEADRQEA